MKTSSNSRLWRVEWVHRSGYQAPSQYVAAKTRMLAIRLAKSNSRLGDFPESWSCYPEFIRDIVPPRRKKDLENELV